jgi:hypothetical protein
MKIAIACARDVSKPRRSAARLLRWSAITTASAVVLLGITAPTTTKAAPKPLLAEIPAPTGPPVAGKALVSGADEINVLPHTEGVRIGAAPLPDVHPTYLRFDDGSIRFWIQGGGGTSIFTTTDFMSFRPSPVADHVSPVLGPRQPQSKAFDADYAGGSSIFPAANKTDLTMIYHAENHYGRPYGSAGVTAFYASIGIARSSDGGVTWSRQGPIITGREAQTAYPPPGIGLGANNPSAIVTGGYIYVFFVDAVSPSGPFRGIHRLCLARAPIASDGAVGTWMKYYQKSFSEPGLGGLCDAPIPPPPAKSGITFESNPDISFNTALNAYLLVFRGDDGFFYSTASDMMNWSSPVMFMATPPALQALKTPGSAYYYYPLAVTPSAPSDELTGASGYIFYAKGIEDAKLTQSSHSWYRRSWSIK